MSPSVSVRLLLSQSDARLVAFARAGHERAFEALVQRYRRQLHSYCRRLLLSDERAEDALQQALLQAWLALRAGTEVGEVRPWLYRIVHNAAVNALRASGYDYCKLSESLSGADAPQADLDRRIAVREALAGLAALPDMQREALLRTAVEGRSHQQVARDLGLTEHALRGLVYRARATLRAAAGAFTPPPIVNWALGATRGTPVVERLTELGAGGGSAGIAGLLMKGGAVAVTATVLAGGIVAGHHHPKTPANRLSAAAARAPSAAPTAVASAQPARWTSASHTQATPGRGRPSSIGAATPRATRFTPRPDGGHRGTALASPFSPAAPNSRRSDGRRGRDGGGNVEALTSGGGGATGQGDKHGETGSNGGGFGSLDGKDGGSVGSLTSSGGSGDGTSGSSTSGSSTSGSSTSGGSNGGSGGGGSDPTTETGQSGNSPDLQSNTDASSSTSTNTSSKDGQSATEEVTK